MISHIGEMVVISKFLSSNTQDFIEVMGPCALSTRRSKFLSSNTQDFIEVIPETTHDTPEHPFLSSNTQDFIEVNSRFHEPGGSTHS